MNHRNKLVLVWATVEERETDQHVDEANVVKLARMIAKERGWQEVVIC